MTEQMDPLAVSAPEAARLLGISKPKVYELMNRDDFPAFRIGGRTLISVEGLREWVRAQSNKNTALSAATPRAATGKHNDRRVNTYPAPIISQSERDCDRGKHENF